MERAIYSFLWLILVSRLLPGVAGNAEGDFNTIHSFTFSFLMGKFIIFRMILLIPHLYVLLNN